jgi:hypothetical protein
MRLPETETYRLIRRAILNSEQVIATYGNHRREMCPHALGHDSNGEEKVLFYQFAGQSSSPLGPEGSPENWRCMRVANLLNVVTRPGTWHTASNGHSSPSSCMTRVDLDWLYLQSNRGLGVSHDRAEETLANKSEWFRSLSLTDRMDLLCSFTDIALEINPGIVDLKDAEQASRSIRILSKARR